MTHVKLTGHFDAPIERVFELCTDYKRYPEWSVNYTEVIEVVGPPTAVGTRIHSVMRFMGRRMEGWAEVVASDPPRLVQFKGTSLEGGNLEQAYRFTAVGNGTDVELAVDYELPGMFGQIMDRLFIERAIERDLRHSIESFKALVEAPQPALA